MSFFMIAIGVVIGWMIAEYIVIGGVKTLWRRQVQKSGPNSVNIQAKGDAHIVVDGKKIDGHKWTNHEATWKRHPDNQDVDDLKRNTLE